MTTPLDTEDTMQPYQPESDPYGRYDLPAQHAPQPQPAAGPLHARGTGAHWISLSQDGMVEIAGGERIGARGATVRVHVSQITGVELRPATALTNGALRILMGGVPAVRERSGHRNTDARKDAYAVPFRKRSQDEMRAMRDAIEAAQGQFRPRAW
ncbi:DUF4429 domain-containing protein [Actinomadura harenae]|uniref:DUF4429 domain-containing protein n=1 Tax=Actinomadura harenae TaxID=2483351 RepID=UPI0036708A79